jgi:hypothetical protein
MNEQSPLPYPIAAVAEVRCVAHTFGLLLRGRIKLPRERVGMRVDFADGTSARVYRETVVDGIKPREACVLLVKFRLRFVRGWWHTAFRWESLLNTPLFVGFPGFVSKLWLAHDEHNVYRGIYEWDGPQRAERYARSLWRVLAIGCVPTSIHYRVLPGLRRDQLLTDPTSIDASAPDAANAWWQPLSAT